MENHNEHTPEQPPSPTTPTEASDNFLNRRLIGKHALALAPTAAMIGLDMALGYNKLAIAQGALSAIAYAGALLVNRHYRKK